MTQKELEKEIASLEEESLCWFSPSELREMGLQYRTVEKALEDGILIYAGKDDLFL
jgi:hypothetical protein